MKMHSFPGILLSLQSALVLLSAESPRIVGGSAATPGAYPWMTALLDKQTTDIFAAQGCGATLIHPYWALTAAQCVQGRRAADTQVIVGATDLNASGLNRIDVLEIIVHPQYLPTGYDYDAALLLLAQPVTNASPVEIIDDPSLVQPGVMATAVGWGMLSETATTGSSVLQQVEIPIVDQTIANSPDHLNGDVTENMLAAGREEGGADTCGGDIGGPLVFRGRNGQWVQAGIASWGDGCGQPKKPGVYTRVSKIRQWVQSIVWPNFAAWETEAGISADDGPDADRDGETQWLEYALRRNPRSGTDSTEFPKAGLEFLAGHLFPTLTVRRPLGGGDVAWGIQAGSNLSGWTTMDPAAQQIGSPAAVPGDAGAEAVTWRGLEGTDRSFLRAVVKPGGSYVNQRRTLVFPGGVRQALHGMDTITGGFRSRDYLLAGLPADRSVILTLRSDAFDAELRLVNADTGAVISTSNTNTGSGNDEKLVFTPSSGVRYSARVTTQSPGGLGEFTLGIFRDPAGLPVVSGSQTIAGSLANTDPPDDFYPGAVYYADDYVFVPATASAVTVFMSASSYHPSFSIINAETSELLLAATGVQETAFAMQSFVPRPGVTYFLRASSYFEEQTGTYTLKTVATPAVSVGDQKSGSLSATDGLDPFYAPDYAIYADDYILTGSVAGTARTVTVNSGSMDVNVEILDAVSGASIAYNDNANATTTNSRLTFTPQTGTSYLIRVSEYEEEFAGSYTLLVQ